MSRFSPIIRLFSLLLVLVAGLVGCNRSPNEAEVVTALLKYRAGRDQFMRTNPQSPFNSEEPVTFAPLRYYPPDISWIYRSRLVRVPNPETINVLDTQGELRQAVVFGTLTFERNGRSYQLRVYRMEGDRPNLPNFAVWFTDETTGDTTYDVGRYLDFEWVADPEHVYTIDFNRAYNPYCAYSPAFACPIPREEDHLDLAVTAGEMTWHKE